LARFRTNAAAHLSFGAGPHHCLGWRLAEAQLSILLEVLLRRLPDIRALDAGRRLRSNFISGYKSLDVVFSPDRPASTRP
jgi:cytochrome P450